MEEFWLPPVDLSKTVYGRVGRNYFFVDLPPDLVELLREKLGGLERIVEEEKEGHRIV